MEVPRECDQIELFFKVSAINFRTKVAQIFGNYFGQFQKCYFKSKTIVATAWANFAKILIYFLFQNVVILIYTSSNI